jgi:CheY-like chemotaxis protein
MVEKIKAKVLVLDDEPGVLSAIKRELRDIADICVTVKPDEALELLKKHKFSVVISDHRMPLKDGSSFLAELGEPGFLSYEPVKILLTAYSEFEIILDAVNRAGIWYFLRKPWDSNELKLTIQRAIEVFNNNNELKFYRQRLKDLEGIKKNITSILNHELKTPLTAISGYAELLEKQDKNGDFRDLTVALQASVQRLEDFIEDSLRIARMQAGVFITKKVPVDLREIVPRFLPYVKINYVVENEHNKQGLKANVLSIDSDYDLLSEVFYRVARYFEKISGFAEGKLCLESGRTVMSINAKFSDGMLFNDEQTALFELFETNSDINNYSSTKADMDIIFTNTALRVLGGELNITANRTGILLKMVL